MSDSFLRKHTLRAFFAVYSLFCIQNLNKSFIAAKRTNVAYLQQTFRSDIRIFSRNRNDIVIIITMDWTKYDMSE